MAQDLDEKLGTRLAEERSTEAVFRLRLLPHRQYEYVSPAIRRLTGYEPSAFYADPGLLRDLVASDDRAALDALDYATIEPDANITVRMHHRDGRELWTEHVLWPVRDGGMTVAVEGTIRDVSKWQQAADTLHRLGRTLSDAFDGLADVDSRTLRFTKMDPKAAALMGIDPSEVTRRGISDVFDEAACTRLVQTGALIAAGKIDRSSLETVVRRRGRPDRDVLIRLSASEGNPPELLLLFEDRTAEQRLGAERVRLEAAVGSATDAVAIIDSSHSFLFTNTAFQQLTGYAARECIGFRPEILRALLPDPALWASVGERTPWKGMVRGSGKGERPVETLSSVSPVHEPGGENVSFVVVLHDITEARTALTALGRERGSRDRLTEALASLDDGASIEDIALALCHAALALPDVAAAVLLDLSLDAEPAVVALSPRSGFENLAPQLMAPGKLKAVLAQSHEGSWVEETALLGNRAEGPGFSLDGASLLVLSPIRHADRLLGLLAAVGGDSLRDDVRSLGGLASTAAGLLGPGLLERAEKRLIRRGLTDVLAHRRFRPIFQPIINIVDGGTVAWEATTRFDDGRPPAERFAEALLAGMTIDLEAAATRAAVTEASLNDPEGWLSLNVSATFLGSGDRLLDLLPGPSRRVVLELANASDVDDRARAVIARLPGHVQLAVDSTSREMHTLHAVVDLRPAFIKLPMDLVRGINHDRVRQALVAGLEHFARNTSSDLIAVGVETEAEFATLLDLKVSYAQGDYLGPAGFFPISSRPDVDGALNARA
jgi:PAS domain S-box-containing protein